MRPLLRGVVAAVVLSLAPVAAVTTTAASAATAETITTTTAITPDRTRGHAGSFLSITGAVATVDGSSPLAGTAFLQRLAPGAKTWKNVGNDTSPGYADYPDHDMFTTNAKYRIYFTGGTYSDTTYTPSVSEIVTIRVFRNVDITSVAGKPQPTADVRVSPKFATKKLLVQKRAKKGWNTFRRVTTNEKGKVRLSFAGSRRGTDYRLVAPGNKRYTTTKTIITVTLYRPIAA